MLPAYIPLYVTSGSQTVDTDVFEVTDEYQKSINSNGIYYMKIKSNTEVQNSPIFIKGLPSEWENSGSTARTLTISEVSMYEYQEGMENWDLPYMVGEMRGTGLAKIESIVNGGEKELVDVLGETRKNLINTISILLKSSSDTNSTDIFSLIPSVYTTKAVISIDLSKIDKYRSIPNPVIVEMFDDMINISNHVLLDINKSK